MRLVQVYSQQPSINRASQSHLDNEGVRALVDGVCHRVNAHNGAAPLLCRFLCPLLFPCKHTFSPYTLICLPSHSWSGNLHWEARILSLPARMC